MEAPYGSPRSFTCAIPFLAGAPAPAPLSPDIPFDCDPPPFDDGGALRAASCRRCSAAIRCACPGFVPPTMDENLGGGGAVTVAGGAAAAAARADWSGLVYTVPFFFSPKTNFEGSGAILN